VPYRYLESDVSLALMAHRIPQEDQDAMGTRPGATFAFSN
jgi:hypothetical protein